MQIADGHVKVLLLSEACDGPQISCKICSWVSAWPAWLTRKHSSAHSLRDRRCALNAPFYEIDLEGAVPVSCAAIGLVVRRRTQHDAQGRHELCDA